MIHEGTCIGGPYAGMFYATPAGAAFAVHHWRPRPDEEGDSPTQIFLYRHLRNEFGDWWVVE